MSQVEWTLYPKTGEYGLAVLAKRRIEGGRLIYEDFHLETFCAATEGWSKYVHACSGPAAVFSPVGISFKEARPLMCAACLEFMDRPTRAQIQEYIKGGHRHYENNIHTPLGWVSFWIAQDGGERVVLQHDVGSSTVDHWAEEKAIEEDPAAQRERMVRDFLKTKQRKRKA